jgi:protein Xni
MSMHVVLIDALNLIRRIYAVQERPFLLNKNGLADDQLSESTKQQILTNTQQACSLALSKILTQMQATHALAVFDSDVPCWRYQLYSDYKKGRKKMPNYLASALTDIQDTLMQQNVDSLISDEDEADDLIATLAVKVAIRGQKVTIISTDKGFLSLINQNINVYDYFNKRYLDEDHIQNKFNVKSHQLIDFWMLTGDSTNRIPGVSGIGQVTASSLLNQYQSLTSLVKADDLKTNIHNKLVEAKEQFKMTRQLLTLKQDIPLGFNLKDIRLTNVS